MVLLTAWTHGSTFNYSYYMTGRSWKGDREVGGPVLITGSLDGDQYGNFVRNVHNVKVFFNGTPMTGTVVAYQHYPWAPTAPPVVSFNAVYNNFAFANNFTYNNEFFLMRTGCRWE